MLYKVRSKNNFLFEVRADYRKNAFQEIRELLKSDFSDEEDIQVVNYFVDVEQHGDVFDIYLNRKETGSGKLIDGDNFIKTYKTKQGAINKANKLAKENECKVEYSVMA